ncbi:hypothetical protein B6N13_14380 [Marinomonas sp. UCMA 3892]|uniref:hypothetical protein n=1 Tax=Marinomonas sp. UCMA 3892 TaxID=1972585 RepID=UPI001469DEF7|nr:hypothetical protein [Marinomonas sp. UCMA 3892]NLU99265.1 hypothetical protein [Marinomonas sp. UCMA 3892]
MEIINIKFNIDNVIALFISIIAILISILGYCKAVQSYNISKKQHDERYSSISANLINSFKWVKDDCTYISFLINFTNLSTVPNSLSMLMLNLECIDGYGNVSKVLLYPENNLSPINLYNNSNIFNGSLNLSERNTETGWISYKIPAAVKNNVDRYTVESKDSLGRIVSISAHIVNRI